ncbi:SDR family oxidoreductase [Paraburkholderia megapolitana]|uniref:NADP-dependent 3-hydroxy acid dehydrogenase YdfG n=1 Tax=Paraburkholderia megapolitana TaxID=420953 RepID=A0A1I3TSR9_9BURK|nr:SDR family oxidoreductase [Paraburkholderia megapolitana]QDQ83392.1 SDR family NAD(P)-dependent oxidoreductase [Paraburkholderia megapolitana]SFJ73379.1 NADP-dependent 3-hydroxy acid dehydrogenase YdfG [Paraburkholderia megapolitana]
MINHRVAAVSGGTSGIGYAVLETLVQADVKVSFSGRRTERIQQIAVEHNESRHRVEGVAADAVDEDHVDRLFEAANHAFGERPSAFVLCAGRGLPGSVTGSDASLWEELLRVNVLGVMRQLRACATFFKDTYRSASGDIRDIVVIGSTVGRTLSAGNPVYGATKFALHSLVESLRVELCEHSVRVSLIEPGFVKTEFQATAGYDMKWFNEIEQTQGPLLSAQDVATSIRFVLEQPPHVHIDDIRIRPTRQRA